MTGTDVARFTHKQSRSYLNRLVKPAEKVSFCYSLTLTYLVLLLSRYYLSRFKDTYRQATIDMMLGECSYICYLKNFFFFKFGPVNIVL